MCLCLIFLIKMKLGGLQKTSLIDYPGTLACTVFTLGCCFRCPFCHNPELVISNFEKDGAISEKNFLKFLVEKKGKLEGVCITGGEPTIQKDIIDFIRKIKDIGYKVKLDTNGIRPDVLVQLIKKELIDYIAMDIKNSPDVYQETCGTKVDIERIKLSIDLIKNFKKQYEFRTTVVPSIHNYKDFEKIGGLLAGSSLYVLQRYQDKGKILNEKMRSVFKRGEKLDLGKIKNNLKGKIKKIKIRD